MIKLKKATLSGIFVAAANSSFSLSGQASLAQICLDRDELEIEGFERAKPWNKIDPNDGKTFPPAGKVCLWVHAGTGKVSAFSYDGRYSIRGDFENYYWKEVPDLPPIRKFDKSFDMQFFGVDVMVVKLFSDLPFCDIYDVFFGVPEGHPFFGKKNEKVYGYDVIHTGYGIHYFPQNEKEWVDKIWWVGVNIRVEHDHRNGVLGHAFQLAKNIYEAGGGK